MEALEQLRPDPLATTSIRGKSLLMFDRRFMFLAVLLLSPLVPRSVHAIEPWMTDTLAEASCGDRTGSTTEFRLVWLRYRARLAARRDAYSNAFAVETGDPITCSVPRLWQDFAPNSEEGSDVMLWRGALLCPQGDEEAYVVLVGRKYPDGLRFVVYPVTLAATVTSVLPTERMVEGDALEGSLRPAPLAEMAIGLPQKDCLPNDLKITRKAGRIEISMRHRWGMCPPVEVTVQLKEQAAIRFTMFRRPTPKP